ncbi:MAG: DUF2911 domain-containing protein [Gemmatimonadota bacterium]
MATAEGQTREGSFLPTVRRAALGIAAGGAALLATTAGLEAQPADGCWIRGDPADLELRISRLDSASVELGGETVKVCYSRPRKLDRPIMGRLVPFGEPWRLGANEATVIHLPFAASVADVPVEAGSYSLYAFPDRESWRIVVNEETRRWGIPIDEEVRERDVGSGTVPAERIEETVETMTVRLERVSETRARMRVEWERTGVTVPIRRIDPEDLD